MSKPTLLFRGPVETRSGYGSHARDVLECLHKMDMFEISVDSCMWGVTPMTAMDESNEFHNWIKEKMVTSFNGIIMSLFINFGAIFFILLTINNFLICQ